MPWHTQLHPTFDLAVRDDIIRKNPSDGVMTEIKKSSPDFKRQHHLRHTFCTRLCENESNLKVIQSVMGHSDIQTTMDIYAECTQEKKQEVFATLNGKIMVK